MSFPSRLRVLVLGSSAPGSAGSGICFTHTTTFMARILPRSRRCATNRADGLVRAHCCRAIPSWSTRTRRGSPADVGGRRSRRGLAERPRRVGRGDRAIVTDATALAAGLRWRTESMRSRCSAATAPSTRWRTRWSTPAACSWPLPGGGTNVFCRSLGLPDDPGRAAAETGSCGWQRIGVRSRIAASGPPATEPFRDPHRRRVGRGARRRWSSATSASSGDSATRCTCTPVSAPSSRTTTGGRPFTCELARRTVRTRSTGTSRWS